MSDFTPTDLLTLRIDGAIAWLQLSRPGKRNAINQQMLSELQQVCQQLARCKTVHLLIISGSGGVFSAGGDVTEWGDLEATEFAQHWVRKGHLAFDALARLPHPVIGVLNGHTLGGGLELAACCDYRIAERQIRLGQPESGIGIIPGWSGTQRLVRRFGAQTVKRMAMFGEVFEARQALELGLVDKLADKGKGLVVAKRVAEEMLKRSPHATGIIKMLINAAEGEERESVLDILAGMAVNTSDELQEGLAAFRAKRSPDFTGVLKPKTR